MITLVVHYRVRQGAADAAIEGLRDLQTASRAERGCIRYEVAQLVDHADQILPFEQYVDEAALEHHTASDHFRHIVHDRLAPHLEERVRERFVAG